MRLIGKESRFYVLTVCIGLLITAPVCSETVRVGWFNVSKFQEKNDNGERSGYVYEFLNDIAKKIDVTYSYTDGTRDECIDLLNKGKIDIICSLCEGEEPPNATLTKQPFSTSFFIILSRKDDNRFSFEDYTSMKGMTIATISSTYHNKIFLELEKKNNFSATLHVYDYPEEALSALVHREADLAMVTSLSAATGFNIVSRFGVHKNFIAVTNSKPNLRKAIDSAIDQLITENPDYEETLLNEYISQNAASTISLTAQEKKFITTAPVITVYMREDVPVLSYEKKKKPHGFMKYILDDISEHTGLHFKYILVANNSIAIAKSKEERNSVNCFAAQDFKWGEKNGYLLTSSITDLPLACIYRANMNHNIYNVGYFDNLFYPDSFLKKSPYTMIPFKESKQGLDAVLHGQSDAYLTNLYSAQQLLKSKKYKKLIMSNSNTQKLNITFALRADSTPELYTILDKGIRNISQAEKSNYLRQSISDSTSFTLLDFIQTYFVVIILVILLFALLLFIIITQKRNSYRLAEASKNKDIFLANMSHDFRTPLTAIKGFAYLGQTEQNTKYYDQIISSSDYLLELVKDILNIQQYAQGKTLELTPTAINTQTIFNDIYDVVNARAKVKHIAIETNPLFSHHYIYVDELRIKQVFINIISNAIKYSNEGSTVTWNISDCTEGTIVHFKSQVIDHGVGMSNDFLHTKLFKAFEREHNAFSISEGGSGLGLVITKMVIDRMGGTISAESTIGEGTTFTLDIPVETLSFEKYAELSKKNISEMSTFDFTGKHILVCEDNELNIFIIKNLLEKRGCIVDVAENGKVGVDKFEQSKEYFYDVILMDIRMPVLDGLQATAKIRSLTRKDAISIPVVALSANASEEDKSKSEQSGINAHLSKPIDVDVLFTTLAKLLS